MFKMSKLEDYYQREVILKMKEKFGFKNSLAVPKIEKIVINVGFGLAIGDSNFQDLIKKDLEMITGQKPVIRKAKKAISAFKLKKGQPIGLKITLRRKRMYDFLDKLINVALPRTKDFKGVTARFDNQGNLTIGHREQTVFPEIEEGVEKIYGLETTICVTTKKEKEAKELLKLLGMPFRNS